MLRHYREYIVLYLLSRPQRNNFFLCKIDSPNPMKLSVRSTQFTQWIFMVKHIYCYEKFLYTTLQHFTLFICIGFLSFLIDTRCVYCPSFSLSLTEKLLWSFSESLICYPCIRTDIYMYFSYCILHFMLRWFYPSVTVLFHLSFGMVFIYISFLYLT